MTSTELTPTLTPTLIPPLDPIEKLIRRILFFKNPYDQLDARPDMSNDKIRKKYRKLTLQVHPDRCKHPKATDAAAALARAMAIIDNPEQRKPFVEVMERAKNKVVEQWERKAKKWRLPKSKEGNANGVDDGGLPDEDDSEAWVEDQNFLYEWRRETHNLIVEIEKRMKKTSDIAAESEKKKAQEQTTLKEERKAKEEHDKKWESGRETRVQSWREYMSNKRAQPSGHSGELRPPKERKEERPSTNAPPPPLPLRS